MAELITLSTQAFSYFQSKGGFGEGVPEEVCEILAFAQNPDEIRVDFDRRHARAALEQSASERSRARSDFDYARGVLGNASEGDAFGRAAVHEKVLS